MEGETNAAGPQSRGSRPPAGSGGERGGREGGGSKTHRNRRQGGVKRSAYRFEDQLEHAICQLVKHWSPRGFPATSRPELATSPPVVVARTETAVLLCDGLHEGPHFWPNGDQLE